MSIKTLIVHGNVVCRMTLKKIVAELDDFEVVGVASNGETTLARLEKMPIDVVLLDLYLADTKSIELIKTIKEKHPKTIVILLSGPEGNDDELVMDALSQGAMAFIEGGSSGLAEKNTHGIKKTIERTLNIVRVRHITTTKDVLAPSSPVLIKEGHSAYKETIKNLVMDYKRYSPMDLR